VIIEGEAVEVTRIVEGETVKETVVVEVPAADERKVIRMDAQSLTPREMLDTDRTAPPQQFWVTEREYETLHPDIDIEIIPEIPTGRDEWFATQMTAGTAPEIVWYQRGYIQRDYAKGWLVNLSPALDEPNEYVPDNEKWYDVFQVPCIESGRAPDGDIYMITGDIVGTGIFYNKDVFADVGVKVPTTWKEFDEVQSAIREAGQIPFSVSYELPNGVGLYGSWSTRVMADVLYDARMGEIKGTGEPVERTWKPGENIPTQDMVNAILEGRYSAKDAEWLEMLRLLKEWSVHYPEGFWAVPADQVFPLWIQGDAAMAWLGSWMNKPVRTDPIREFEWGVLDNLPTVTEESSPFGGAPFPAMAGVGGVFQYAIAYTAEENGVLAETIDWMKFITAPRNLIALLNDHGGFAPGTKDTTGADPTLSVYTDMMVKYGTERMEPFDSMLTTEFKNRLWERLQLYMAGEMSAEEMTDQVQEDMITGANILCDENPDWGC
jgi:ABC-type glycerol-3-phosphate transport system substrate-binding protein